MIIIIVFDKKYTIIGKNYFGIKLPITIKESSETSYIL